MVVSGYGGLDGDSGDSGVLFLAVGGDDDFFGVKERVE